MTKVYLLLLISFTLSCKVSKPGTDSEKMMILTMDLSSINLSETQRVIPATFETVTTPITLIDKIHMEGFYTEKKLDWLVKDSYTSLKATNEKGFIIFQSDTLMTYDVYKEVVSEKKIKEYRTFEYCATCDATNGIPLTEVKKIIGAISNTVGKPHQKMISRQKIYNHAMLAGVYPDGKKTMTVSGTKSELEQLLAHPKLNGIKYDMKKLK